MSDQEQVSQLSALFDGELPSEQAGMVIRRALKEPAMRAAWGRYALIGACLRDEPLQVAIPGHDLAERVRARLANEADHSVAEPVRPAAAVGSRGVSLLGRGALGGAIAAGVALVSLFIVRNTGPADPVQAAPQIAQAAPAVQAPAPVVARTVAAAQPAQVRDTQPPSYTTPVDNSPASQLSPLVNYVALHSEVAASAARFSAMSSMMNGGYDLTQDAVEMTAAEVGALR